MPCVILISVCKTEVFYSNTVKLSLLQSFCSRLYEVWLNSFVWVCFKTMKNLNLSKILGIDNSLAD